MRKLFIPLFAFLIIACTPETHKVAIEKPDFEIEIINAVLPRLIADYPSPSVIPIKGESDEHYDKRLQVLHDEMDSVGKKVEVLSKLEKLDTLYINYALQSDSSLKMKLLHRAPTEDKKLLQSSLSKIKGVEIVLVDKPRTMIGAGFQHKFTMGQIKFSRVGFNADSTRAALKYFHDNGGCMNFSSGLIELKRSGEKWKIVE